MQSALGVTHSMNLQATAMDHWLAQRKQVPKDLRRAFDALFLLVSWLIWKERNSRVFDRVATMPAWLLPKIREEGICWVQAGFRRLAPVLESWSRNPDL